MDIFGMVEEFHQKFDLPGSEVPVLAVPWSGMQVITGQMDNTKNSIVHMIKSNILSEDQALTAFRVAAMLEELVEYCQAVMDGDITGQFDAMIDGTYFHLGTAVTQGFPFNEGFEMVHEANMKKERAVDPERSKRGHGSDIIKPDGWHPPDLSQLLSQD